MTKQVKLSDLKTYKFPKEWNLLKITQFLNQDFKMCPYCSKVDIRLSHLNDCNGHNPNDDYWSY